MGGVVPGIHRGVAATFVVALATAAAIGIALDSWRLSCSGMAVALSI